MEACLQSPIELILIVLFLLEFAFGFWFLVGLCTYLDSHFNCNYFSLSFDKHFTAFLDSNRDALSRSYIFSFIHCRHLYSASSSGATQKRSQPQRGRIMLF